MCSLIDCGNYFTTLSRDRWLSQIDDSGYLGWIVCDICATEAYMILVCASTGGGAESEVYYPQWRRINQSIERPSTLNESLIRLIDGIG